MAGWAAGYHVDNDDGTEENEGLFGGVFSLFSRKKSTKQQKKMATKSECEQQPVRSQPKPSSKNSNSSRKAVDSPVGRDDNPKAKQHADLYDEWQHVQHPNDGSPERQMTAPSQSPGTPPVHSLQVETDSVKQKHHQGQPKTTQASDGEDQLTEQEKELMEVLRVRTMEKKQLADEKHNLEEKIQRQNKEILVLRDQVKQLVAELEKQTKWLKQLQPDSSDDTSEDHQSERQPGKCAGTDQEHISQLEAELNKMREHSKAQSRKVLELRQEAHGTELQLKEQVESYYGLYEDAEEQIGHLQKDLSNTRSELERTSSELQTVVRFKESLENDLKVTKEEAFRRSQKHEELIAENKQLRAQIVKLSESISTSNEQQRKIFQLENEKAEITSQLEGVKAQVAIFQADFAEERKDREKAHGKLADLQKELAQQQFLFAEEKAEYIRQFTVAHQEAEDANIGKHKKTQQKKQTEAVVYWQDQAAALQNQLKETQKYVSELEQARSDAVQMKQENQAKDGQIEKFRKELEKNSEIEKLMKKLKKFEENGKTKKEKKNSHGTSPKHHMEAAHRGRAKSELLLSCEASSDNQGIESKVTEMQQELTQLKKLKGQVLELQNENHELNRRVEVMQENLKEQDKRIQSQDESEATTPDSTSAQIRLQLEMQYQRDQMKQDQYMDDHHGVKDGNKIPFRAAAPLENATPDFDDVTSDSASQQRPSQPLRASNSDALPSPNVPGPSNMSHNECYTGNPSHVPANQMAGNYSQRPAGSVAEQMRFEQYPQPRVNPGAPQVPIVPPERSGQLPYDSQHAYQRHQQNQPLVQQYQQHNQWGQSQVTPYSQNEPPLSFNADERFLQQQREGYPLNQQQMQARHVQDQDYQYQIQDQQLQQMQAPGHQPHLQMQGPQEQMQTPHHQPQLQVQGPQEQMQAPGYQPQLQVQGPLEQMQAPVHQPQLQVQGPLEQMQAPHHQPQLQMQGQQEQMQAPHHQPQLQAQEQERIIREQKQQVFQAKQRRQQMQDLVHDRQQHVGNDPQQAYVQPGIANEQFPSQQQFNQSEISRPDNIPYQPNLSNTPGYNQLSGMPTTPEAQNFVIPQESSNSQPPTDSLVGVQQKSVPTLRHRSHEVTPGAEKKDQHVVQLKPKSDPFPNPQASKTQTPTYENTYIESEANEAPPVVDPNDSINEKNRFANVLQDSIDMDIESRAAEVREEVSGGADRNATNTNRPFDPNLICPMCNKAFRIGEIQRFRAHVNQCEGTKKGGPG